MGAIFGAAVGLAVYPAEQLVDLSADGRGRGLRRLALGDDPGDPADAVQHQRNPRLADAGLCRADDPGLDGARACCATPKAWAFPASATLQLSGGGEPELIAGTGHALGRGGGLHRGDRGLYPAAAPHPGLPDQAGGRRPRAPRAFAGCRPTRLVVLCMGISGALAGLAGLFEVTGPAGQISIDFNVGLRLHRDHRGLPWPAATRSASCWRGF